jgi:hypothetical protein
MAGPVAGPGQYDVRRIFSATDVRILNSHMILVWNHHQKKRDIQQTSTQVGTIVPTLFYSDYGPRTVPAQNAPDRLLAICTNSDPTQRR